VNLSGFELDLWGDFCHSLIGLIISMKYYQWIRRVVPAFLIIYCLGGFLALLTPAYEVFPVFSWFLFPLTPGDEIHYELRVYEYGGVTVNPPCLYQEGGGRFVGEHSIELFELIQSLGRATESKNDLGEQGVLLLLENYLKAPYQVELVNVSYSPVERWKTGSAKIIPLKSFKSGNL